MMAEDNAEEGDGGDSDVEGDEVNMHYQAMTAIEENDLDLDEWGEVSDPSIPGAPEGWIPPSAQIGFICYCAKFDAPSHFSEVDNPGRWSDLVFQPKYVKVKGRDKTTTSTYAGHFTPAGAKVVPADSFGQREVNGWKFFYSGGWEPDQFDRRTFVRGQATKDKLEPESTKDTPLGRVASGSLPILFTGVMGLLDPHHQSDSSLVTYIQSLPDPGDGGNGAFSDFV
jgi:hypothetical protein